MKLRVLLLGLTLAAGPALAQKMPAKTPANKPAVPTGPAPAFHLSCADQQPASALQKLHCQTRELALSPPPPGTPLTVDARANGSITVRAWPGSDVRVRVRVTGRAATPEAARGLVAAVAVSHQNNLLRAARANESLEGWAVDYEVLVPEQTDLALRAGNGALVLENVRGTLRFETTTGNVLLRGVGGDVRGKTTTGNLDLIFSGEGWSGPGLDVSTVTGDVSWQLPATYAGTLLARTNRGRVTARLNTKRLSVLPHNLAATLGKGGAQLKVSTVNGNVRVAQEPLPQPAAEPADSLLYND
ncbi:DUF4097 family beta strand repeat-containing protein [Hymenobacter rubripertinctus]|uniref:Adhesin domain-containing protein n=1 Tax=Hymenobacter rubripertinctus TaxID=2029981 RepID=A0A418QQ31_9BACT|nr:hypothetical protein [Hymenobacter rubripertinctus]RIY07221.1 hypothetical protein D0T11_16905 [Hymenobacter rubripertinctus]